MTVVWLSIALLVGFAAGLFYFVGLWLTVSRLPTVSLPGVWMAVSFLVRTAVVLTSLYLVMGQRWERCAAAMIGFVLSRILVVYRWGEVSHAGTLPGSAAPLGSSAAGGSSP